MLIRGNPLCFYSSIVPKQHFGLLRVLSEFPERMSFVGINYGNNVTDGRECRQMRK